MNDPITILGRRLMVAVANSGAVENNGPAMDRAVAIMREELKAFVLGEAYADERELVKTGGSQLAWASLVAECIRRISAKA